MGYDKAHLMEDLAAFETWRQEQTPSGLGLCVVKARALLAKLGKA